MNEESWRNQKPPCPVCPLQGQVTEGECQKRTELRTANPICHNSCNSPYRGCAACVADRHSQGAMVKIAPVDPRYPGLCTTHGVAGRTEGNVPRRPIPQVPVESPGLRIGLPALVERYPRVDNVDPRLMVEAWTDANAKRNKSRRLTDLPMGKRASKKQGSKVGGGQSESAHRPAAAPTGLLERETGSVTQTVAAPSTGRPHGNQKKFTGVESRKGLTLKDRRRVAHDHGMSKSVKGYSPEATAVALGVLQALVEGYWRELETPR